MGKGIKRGREEDAKKGIEGIELGVNQLCGLANGGKELWHSCMSICGEALPRMVYSNALTCC